MRLRSVCIGLAFVCGVTPLRGQSILDTLLTLPAVTVSADRTELLLDEAPTRVEILDSLALATVAGNSLAGILEARTGSFIRRYGPSGVASLSLRGSQASQSVILLEGLPMANPQLGQIDLSLVPASILNRMETRYGQASNHFGAGAIGGVVRIDVLDPAGAGPLATLTASLGAFGQRATGATLQGALGRFAVAVMADFSRYDGAFSYVNQALFPPANASREGADFERTSALITSHYVYEKGDVQLSGWLLAADRGLPGPATQVPAGERQTDRQLRVWTRSTHRSGASRLRSSALYQRLSLQYLNPVLGVDDTGVSWLGQAELEADRILAKRHLFGVGLTASRSAAAHPQLGDGAAQNHFSVFSRLSTDLKSLGVYPSLRWDHYVPSGGLSKSALSPGLAANLRLGNSLRLKASTSRAFRMPTLNDRFWLGAGDNNLEPEKAWSIDTGLRWSRPSIAAEVTGYLAKIRNQITWRPDGALWRPENIGRVRSQGLESAIHLRQAVRSGATIDGEIRYGLTHATNQTSRSASTNGAQLRYVPRHQIKASVSLHAQQAFGGLTGRWVGERFVTEDESEALDPYLTCDAVVGAHLKFGQSRIMLRAVLENIGNRTFAIVKDYPVEPRNLQLHLTFIP